MPPLSNHQELSTTGNYPFLAEGGEMGEFARNYQWSSSPLGSPAGWPKSLSNFVRLMLDSPNPSLLLWGERCVALYNDAFLASTGIQEIERSGFGRPATGNIHIWNAMGPMINAVLAGGKGIISDRVKIAFDGIESELSCSFTPLKGDDYITRGVWVSCTRSNVTAEVKNIQHSEQITLQMQVRRDLETSEARLRSLLDSAPFPIGVYVGEEMRIQLVNQSIIDVWGKGQDVVGKTYAEVLPELENTGIYEQLAGVYHTGIPFHAKNQRVDLVIAGVLQPFYFKYSFTPLFDADGKVYGVMNTAADVTDLVVAQQHLQEAEVSLRGAIELAKLGAWEFDIEMGKVSYSDTIKSWFGFGKDQMELEKVYDPIHPKDRPIVEAAIAHALEPGSDGVYDAEYRLVSYHSDSERIVHARGKVVYDNEGKALKLIGTAQDVTDERRRQEELENVIEVRTEELAAANEELAAQNEEYLAVNEELEEANHLLIRSNENLHQFAYVASHDLQEPLRKIQQFGDLLRRQYGHQIESTGLTYLDRMQSAASRMSTLIEDLLNFSSMSNQRDDDRLLSLNTIIDAVLNDFELNILESGAVIKVDALPSIQGNAMQLGQLFQNLISNALKFCQPGTTPEIHIQASEISARDLPPAIKPSRHTEIYYLIEVIDHGIGFDEQYRDRIFQVFQRLHGKNQFSGTGIGLAICAKVMDNHGGTITATSQAGQGSTFQLYFPG